MSSRVYASLGSLSSHRFWIFILWNYGFDFCLGLEIGIGKRNGTVKAPVVGLLAHCRFRLEMSRVVECSHLGLLHILTSPGAQGTRFKIVFGMPTQAHEDNGVRCVLAALLLQQRLKVHTQAHSRAHISPLPRRVCDAASPPFPPPTRSSNASATSASLRARCYAAPRAGPFTDPATSRIAHYRNSIRTQQLSPAARSGASTLLSALG